MEKNKMMMMMMDRLAGDAKQKRVDASITFWLERLFVILVVVFPTHLLAFTIPIITAFTLYSLYFFFCCPNLISVGPSGIGGFWLFLLDRLTFYLAFEYYYILLVKGFELTFLWRLTVFISFVIHSVYIVEYFLRSYQVLPTSPPQSDKITSGGDLSKQVEEMKELVEDGKMMMTCMENMIHSDCETRRKERGEFLAELSKDEKILMTYMDEIGTLRDDMHLNFDEIRQKLHQVEADVKVSKLELNDVKSMADQLHEIHLVKQETIKEDATIDESNRRVISGENVDGFAELKEQVRRMELEAEIAAEELAREMVKLVRAETVKSARAEILQWEEDNADYIASLPLLYFSRRQ